MLATTGGQFWGDGRDICHIMACPVPLRYPLSCPSRAQFYLPASHMKVVAPISQTPISRPGRSGRRAAERLLARVGLLGRRSDLHQPAASQCGATETLVAPVKSTASPSSNNWSATEAAPDVPAPSSG